MANPILVEVRRGDHVESRHRGAAAIVDAAGAVVAAWGDVERAVFPRSAIKPIQAIPLVESGAADAFALGDDELALACASHEGEPRHVETARLWLERAGFDENALECGTHAPYSVEAWAALIRAGRSPGPLHNNCSGKHSGMLSVARRRGLDPRHYVAPDHAVQQGWRAVLGELAGVDLAGAPVGIDGCNIPTVAVPLAGLARAAAAFATPDRLGAARAEACRRLHRAIVASPFMVAGSGRFCTRAIEAGHGAFWVKTGAEGVFLAALPDAGLGIALKIDDGATRAAEVAMAALLVARGGLGDGPRRAVAAMARPPVLNRRGLAVGEIRPVADWLTLDV